MKKNEYAFWGMMAMTVILAGMAVLGMMRSAPANAANAEIYRQLDLFGQVLERVRKDYVEKPDDKKLIENAINGMLTSLDPHSSYLNAKHFQDMQVQTRGEFGGLGIEVTMENGVVKVVSPIEDTPASRAGIQSGDFITHLDGEAITGLTLNQAVEKMRGPINTPLVLTIVRKGREEPFDVKVVRDKIRINPVKSRIEGGDLGYIRITSFNEQTTQMLKKAIRKINKQLKNNVKGYIIDLRNNPGGLLDQAIEVSDTFLEKGAIVFTRGRNSEENQRANAHPGDLTNGKKIVVLINGGTASASEIVSGALQDHKRAVIVGTRSFGKGSVQTIIPLGPNGAIRLTTARYYTPSNRSIQAKGISPDYVVREDLPDELKKRHIKPRGEASLRGHLKNDTISKEESGSQSYVPRDKSKDNQLKFAINFLHGVKVGDSSVVKHPANAGKPQKKVVPN